MLLIKEKDDLRCFKIYINFRLKTIRVCHYFKETKTYQCHLQFDQETIEFIEYGTYDDIRQFIADF